MAWGNIDKSVVNIDENKRSTADAIRNYPRLKELFQIDSDTPTELENISKGKDGEQLLLFIDVPKDKPELARKRLIVVSFIVSNMLAAEWYSKAMNKSWRWRALYGVLSFAILLGLPFALYGLQYVAASMFGPGTGVAQASEWTGGLTALVTGLMAAQKAAATWFDNHKRFGEQWKARSALRTALYSLGDKWCARAGAVKGGVFEFSPEFIADLELRLAESRQAVRAEQQNFFDNYSYPTVDFVSGVTEARKAATEILSPALDKVSGMQDAQKKVVAAKATLDAWEAEKAKLPQNAAKAEIDGVNAKIAAAKDAYVTALADLSAARQSLL